MLIRFRLPLSSPGDASAVPDTVLGVTFREASTRYANRPPGRWIENLWPGLMAGDLVLTLCTDPLAREWLEVPHHVLTAVPLAVEQTLSAGAGQAFRTAFHAARVRHRVLVSLETAHRIYGLEFPLSVEEQEIHEGLDKEHQRALQMYAQARSSVPPSPQITFTTMPSPARLAIDARFMLWRKAALAAEIAAGRLVASCHGETIDANLCTADAIDVETSAIGPFRPVLVRLPGAERFAVPDPIPPVSPPAMTIASGQVGVGGEPIKVKKKPSRYCDDDALIAELQAHVVGADGRPCLLPTEAAWKLAADAGGAGERKSKAGRLYRKWKAVYGSN